MRRCQRGCAIKWFKHESQARNDERISRLEDKAGLEGYGFYFKLLEIVSTNMDFSDRCDVTYSLSRWGRQANISTKKAVFLLQCCHDVGLIIAQRVNDDMIVNIPNLLKYRDNHTKNLQGTYKQELDKELELELDKELDKDKPNKTKEKPLTPDKSEVVKDNHFLLPDWINKSHWDVWHSKGKRKSANNGQKEIALKKLERWRIEGLDYAKALEDAADGNWQALHEPKINKLNGSGTYKTPYQAQRDKDRDNFVGINKVELNVIGADYE